MAENLSNIYYLSAEQWTEMVTYGYITVDGTRYDYNVNNIYYVKEELPEAELPTVTTTDNGKVLQVVNGAWATGSSITDLSTNLTSVTGRVTTAETNITNLSTTVSNIRQVPASTTEDAGKFLVVNSSGTPEWTTIPMANGQKFGS